MPNVPPGAGSPQAPSEPTPSGTTNPGGVSGIPGRNKGLTAGVADWEAALITYAIGLFVVELGDWGKLYLLGAWAVAFGLAMQAMGAINQGKAKGAA